MTPVQAPVGGNTLAGILASGRLPVLEALRYATLLGKALRKIH